MTLPLSPFLVYAEDSTLADLSKYYYTGADAPITPTMTHLTRSCGGVCIHDRVDGWMTHVPTDNDVYWMVGV